LLVTLLVAQGVQATFVHYSGNRLLTECESTSPIHESACLGYIAGVADASNGKTHEGLLYCIPNEAVAGQLQKIVIKHMDEYPKDLHFAAYSIVQDAFLKAFLCEY